MNGKGEARELGLGESECSGSVPNGEAVTRRSPAVSEKPKRRRHAPEYKMWIVEKADACTQPGKIGALLRREGLYSSHLVDWRREYRTGAAQRLSGRRRGPKGKDPLVGQKEELERQVARLQQRLGQAEKIIEVQKNEAPERMCQVSSAKVLYVTLDTWKRGT